MDGDKITFLVDVFHNIDMLYGTAQIPSRLHRDIWIVSIDIHAKMGCRIGNLDTDGSQTDHTQFLACKFRTCICLFLLFCHLCDISLATLGFDPFNTADNIAGCQKHTGENKFLDTIGICTGCVKYDDTFLGAALQRNVVDTSPRSCDCLQIAAKLHIVHGCTSD